MTTLVLTEDIRHVETELESSLNDVTLWHYSVPCAGVKYYCYQQVLAAEKDPDSWAADELAA